MNSTNALAKNPKDPAALAAFQRAYAAVGNMIPQDVDKYCNINSKLPNFRRSYKSPFGGGATGRRGYELGRPAAIGRSEGGCGIGRPDRIDLVTLINPARQRRRCESCQQRHPTPSRSR